jgi:hypothetical protein
MQSDSTIEATPTYEIVAISKGLKVLREMVENGYH